MQKREQDTFSTGRLAASAEELLTGIRAAGFAGWSALGVEKGRAAIKDMKAFAGPAEPVANVEQISIARPDGSSLTAALYTPDSNVRIPVMVYMHGGGWVIGNSAGVDSLVRRLVRRSGWAILSIDYRLAPEHKYPAALDDVLSAIEWVIANAERRGFDFTSLAVGGDSSGANLAAAAALRCGDQGGPSLAFQLLVCPALDHDFETESYRHFGDGVSSALSRDDVAWFYSLYLERPEERESPYVCPLRATNFVHLPRTLLICAEIDPLRDEAVRYARLLTEAGVPVELQVCAGMFHGFWRMAGVLQEAQDAIDGAGDRMKEIRELMGA